MTLQDELLSIERELWRGTADTYRRHLDEECLVVFTEMAGVSTREQIAGSVEESERWRDLELDPQGILQPTPDVALVTYRASATRGDEERYHALVSSGYVRRDREWKMAFHQQTPLGG